jgi:hypothetical protein
MSTNPALRKLLFLILPVVLLAAVACGGGGGSSNLSDEDKARQAANEFVLNTLGLFSGSRTPQNLIDSFLPECRRGVDASQMAMIVAFVRLFAPELASAKIEAVDLGNLAVRQSGGQYLVRPTNPSEARVRVNGRWVNANEFFKQIGFDDDDDSLVDMDEIAITIRDGRAYIADCDMLQDFGGG